MADTESFSNFKNHRFLVNPDTGVVGVATMVPKGPDGALIPDTKNTFPPSVLSNRIKQNINIYNVAEASKSWVDKLGSNEVAVIGSRGTALQAGIIEKISDIRIREGGLKEKSPEELEKIAKDLGVSVEDLNVTSLFLQAQDKWIDSEISSVVNSLAAGSVLIDYMGTTLDKTPYTSTLDESKIFNKDGSRNESVILLSDVDGRVIANLTDAQKENAKRTMREISDIQVKTKYDMQPAFFEKQRQIQKGKTSVYIDNTDKEASKARRAKERKYNQMADEFAKFLNGTEDEKNRAANYFGGLGDNKKNIKKILPRKSGVLIEYTDGSSKTIKALDTSGKPMEKETFFASYFNYLLPGGYTEFTLKDISEFSNKEGEKYSDASAEGSTITPEYSKEQQAQREFSDYVDASVVGEEGIKDKSLNNVVPILKARFAQSGLDFERNDNNLDIKFKFLDTNGDEQEKKITVKIEGEDAVNVRQQIARNIKELTDDALIEKRGYKTKPGIKRYEAFLKREANRKTDAPKKETKTRSVGQIMKEDGVDRVEAAKIYKNQ